MKGQLQEELVVGVSATAMWEVYGTLQLPNLIPQYLPNVKIDIEQGDGSPGTIIKVTNTNDKGEAMASYFKEIYLVVDNEKRTKTAKHLEGDYADVGFEFFGARIEIIEKGNDECIIRSSVEFEIEFKRIENAVSPATRYLQILQVVAHSMATHLLQKKLSNNLLATN